MSTKYAKARDVAGQWRSEYRKQKRENATLRRALVAAQALCVTLDEAPITPSPMHIIAIENLKREIRAVELYE